MPQYSRRIPMKGRNAGELYDVASDHLERFLNKPQVHTLLGAVQVERQPDEKILQLNSKMVRATLHCEDEAFVVDAKLSLLAAPFRSRIDGAIDAWLTKVFG